jgi:hypothetical protein
VRGCACLASSNSCGSSAPGEAARWAMWRTTTCCFLSRAASSSRRGVAGGVLRRMLVVLEPRLSLSSIPAQMLEARTSSPSVSWTCDGWKAAGEIEARGRGSWRDGDRCSRRGIRPRTPRGRRRCRRGGRGSREREELERWRPLLPAWNLSADSVRKAAGVRPLVRWGGMKGIAREAFFKGLRVEFPKL